jgi:hypothetical protein
VNIEETYRNELNSVRQSIDLLDNYAFDKKANDSKQFDRLRLNIAIYNDLKDSDYDIVKFLFKQEKEWRKYGTDGEVDNLYFCAFVLTHFGKPEIILDFFETKNIDMDSGIGFDGEYLVSTGIESTYNFLVNSNYSNKGKILKYIGESTEDCIYTNQDIQIWKDSTEQYFACFKYPIQDLTYFLYSTRQKELFLKQFPIWINEQQNWTYDKLGLYRTYAKYSENKLIQLQAIKLTIEKNDKDFLTEIYQRELAELYIDNSEFENAFKVLESIIKRTDNGNIVRDCIEQLIRIIYSDKSFSKQLTINAYDLIKKEQIKYKQLSPKVDGLIVEVDNLYKEQKFTAHNKGLPKWGLKWLIQHLKF